MRCGARDLRAAPHPHHTPTTARPRGRAVSARDAVEARALRRTCISTAPLDATATVAPPAELELALALALAVAELVLAAAVPAPAAATTAATSACATCTSSTASARALAAARSIVSFGCCGRAPTPPPPPPAFFRARAAMSSSRCFCQFSRSIRCCSLRRSSAASYTRAHDTARQHDSARAVVRRCAMQCGRGACVWRWFSDG